MQHEETPNERQSKSSSGLRDRLFLMLDGVIAGKIEKEQVEGVCYISQEILKSAKVDLEFEAMAQSKMRLVHEIDMERNESTKLLTTTIRRFDEIIDV